MLNKKHFDRIINIILCFVLFFTELLLIIINCIYNPIIMGKVNFISIPYFIKN